MTLMNHTPHTPHILQADGWRDYKLLDSGHGRKLEQVGAYRFIRPEAQALWSPALTNSEWDKADGEFVASATASPDAEGGKWQLSPDLPDQWQLRYDGMVFNALPTPFRHFGFFPEQSSHWQWCGEAIRDFIRAHGQPPKILNLFGYTGVASLHAAMNGAHVTHVDSSKKAITQAFANRDAAGLDHAPIRYITEDARSFVKREARRDNHYDGVILDPPKYGRGAKGEIWRMEEDIGTLMNDIAAILSPQACFVVLTSYAIRSSFLSLHHLLDETLVHRGGVVSSGELTLMEDSPRHFSIGQAIFGRWQCLGQP